MTVMIETVPQEKSIEVTYKFYIPEHNDDLKIFQKAHESQCALEEIYQECRRMWKYDDKASEETIAFAEKIGKMAAESTISF